MQPKPKIIQILNDLNRINVIYVLMDNGELWEKENVWKDLQKKIPKYKWLKIKTPYIKKQNENKNRT